ncbi:MAG: hypothetical protein JNK82_36040 [Myxococcaceae bacterium]|nr:hypothetical protein [Myxococcaceae bacterium]
MRALPLALAGSVLLSLPAFACLNGMKENAAPEMELMARSAARKLLSSDFSGAAADASTVLQNEGSEPGARRQARRTLGIAKLRLGEFLVARDTLQQSLKDSKDEPTLLARLGEAEVGLGQFKQAKARLEGLKTRDLLPDADAHLALAKAYLALGDAANGKAELDAALKQQPDHAGALALKSALEKPAAPAEPAKKPSPNRS